MIYGDEIANALLNIIDLKNTLEGCRTHSCNGEYDIDGNELNNILITDIPRRHGGTLNSDSVGDLIHDIQLFLEELKGVTNDK